MVDLITILVYSSIYVGLVATTFYILTFLNDRKRDIPKLRDNELPKVSVIIPAYNEEEGIVQTIESILASDYPDFEVIVVDDGSKDKTYELAKKFHGGNVRVFHKDNGGKGTALNFGISKANGDIIFTMDADTYVHPDSMKKMVRYFKNPRVMSVSPAMIIDKPKTILQRVQHVEYLLGLFLRRTFAALNSIYIAPGAFSAYRKSFFDKYGGYEEGNITEDLEMALRIQFKGYYTENCPDAPAYTIAPKKFKALMIQRRRWYVGLIKNTWKYRKIMSPKYGDLGRFVMPIAWISIFFAVVITSYLFVKSLLTVRDEFLFFQSINYDLVSSFNFSFYFIERTLFLFLTNPVVLFLFTFMFTLAIYLIYAAKKIGRLGAIWINLPLFFLLFAILFGFWWIISIFYALFSKEISWR